MTWSYPPELIEGLLGIGVTPRADMAPAETRELADDRYKEELRLLRGRLLAGEFDRRRYVDLIVALRKRFWVLTLPLAAWQRIVTPSD